jgi:hypothetical protein
VSAATVLIPDWPLRSANRVVADEYHAVSAKIDALYGQPPELPADYKTTRMAKLRRETDARMLGNGLRTRPAGLDCGMESASVVYGAARRRNAASIA